MKKQIVAGAIAVFLSLSPALAFAQSANNGQQPELIALLEQLVQLLTTELVQLEQSLAHTSSLSGTSTSNWVSPSATSNSSQTLDFTAAPISGAVPLNVTFTSNTYGTVNFGDGTTGVVVFNDAFYQTSHTYQSPGTYTATEFAPCSGTACTGVVLGSTTITVSNSSQPVAQPGAHCGGFIANPSVCTAGYFCDANGYPPDTGGICVANPGGDAQQPPTISSFSASASSITPGQSSTLSWSVSGATSVSIDNGIGIVTGSSLTVSPSQTTTYTLAATNSSGSATAATTVTVLNNSGGPSIGSFTANPNSGAAPLTVTFQAMVSQTNTSTYSVAFGDGTSGQMSIRPSGIACTVTGPCYTGIATVTHAYTTAGTYTATLINNSSEQNVGSATVTVTN